jgi:hypothetical protein
MANIWEKAISILAFNLNSGLSYLIVYNCTSCDKVFNVFYNPDTLTGMQSIFFASNCFAHCDMHYVDRDTLTWILLSNEPFPNIGLFENIYYSPRFIL